MFAPREEKSTSSKSLSTRRDLFSFIAASEKIPNWSESCFCAASAKESSPFAMAINSSLTFSFVCSDICSAFSASFSAFICAAIAESCFCFIFALSSSEGWVMYIHTPNTQKISTNPIMVFLSIIFSSLFVVFISSKIFCLQRCKDRQKKWFWDNEIKKNIFPRQRQ